MGHIVNDEQFEIRLIARGKLAKRVKRQCDRLGQPARMITALALAEFCDRRETELAGLQPYPTAEQASPN